MAAIVTTCRGDCFEAKRWIWTDRRTSSLMKAVFTFSVFRTMACTTSSDTFTPRNYNRTSFFRPTVSGEGNTLS